MNIHIRRSRLPGAPKPFHVIAMRTIVLIALVTCISVAAAAPGGRGHGRGQQQKVNNKAIQEVKKELKAGGLNATEREFLSLLHRMSQQGFGLPQLLADKDGFLHQLFQAIADGEIDTAGAVERIAALLESYAADGTVDPNELVMLNLSVALLRLDVPWAPSARSVIAILEQLAAAGVDLEDLVADTSNGLVQSLISFVVANRGDRVPQELFELLAQLAADGTLDENDLFILGISAALINIQAGQTVGNSSAVVIMRKLAAAGLDLKALIANPDAQLLQALISFVAEHPDVPVPQQLCDLIDTLAEDGSLDANDLVILTLTTTFMRLEGGASAGTGSAAAVMRKLADAGLDLAALTRDTRNTVLRSLIGFVSNNPGVPVPQELCDLIDALAADGTLDADDLYTLSLFSVVMKENGGITPQSLVLVEIILMLQDVGIDIEELITDDPDGFFVELFFGLINDDISLDDMNDLALLLMDFLMDGSLDPVEKAILLSSVEAARD